MADFESYLARWQAAGLLDAAVVSRIRAFENQESTRAGRSAKSLGWQVIVALVLSAILLGCGVALFVSAHWDKIGPLARLTLVLAMVSLFHLGGAWARGRFAGLGTALHAVGTLSTGAAIALVGQIFNIEEHWPAAVLMWAVAALFGWMLLRDEAQQTLALLLFPAWMASEFAYFAEDHIGEYVYFGRFLVVWAVLYLTFFIGSKRKAVPIIFFIVGAIAASIGIVILMFGWEWRSDQTFLPLGLRSWGWVEIAAIPLLIALFKIRKCVLPVALAICFSMALPFCQRVWMDHESWGNNYHNEPNLVAYLLLATFAIFMVWWGFHTHFQVLAGLGVVWFAITAIAFSSSQLLGDFSRVLIAQIFEAGAAIFVIWWGLRLSKWLVNIGIVGFAVTVIWFYSADIFDKLDRSLGLIGLGILFLAGGWLLEKTRRNLIGGMKNTELSSQDSQEAL